MTPGMFMLVLLPLVTATPAGMGTLHSFTQDGLGYYSDVPAHPMDALAHGMGSGHQLAKTGLQHHGVGAYTDQGGWAFHAGTQLTDIPPPTYGGQQGVGVASAGGVASAAGGHSPLGGSFSLGKAPPGGSSQLHLMQKLGDVAPKPSEASSTGDMLPPVGVAADYTYFAGKLGGGAQLGPAPGIDLYTVPIADASHVQRDAQGAGTQHGVDLHYHDASWKDHRSPSPSPSRLPTKLQTSARPAKLTGGPAPGSKPPSPQQGGPPPAPPAPPPLSIGPPSPEQLMMSNLFVMGMDKGNEQKQLVPEPAVTASRTGGQGPIRGLTAPLHDALVSQGAVGLSGGAIRAPCDLLVDAVFALDDMKNLWLARDAIRYYETQLLPSARARFGVVLCGRSRSFYTALHGHFSALLASLEDLQHANATLDPAQHMPDTPGYRSDNNPYPPRVSEDFAQIDAGCLETAYHLLTYQNRGSAEHAQRLLTMVATKERWSSPMAVQEARFLHSLNFSLLALADGASLSSQARESLRNMASSPDKFRVFSDNVTLHALPAMIGSAICRPHKADVTMTVQRTSLGNAQEPVMTDCRLLDPRTMVKTLDFGPFFGIHMDRVHCVTGLVPDLQSCTCI